MAGRGDAFFEQELTLSNLPLLLKAGALRSSFEERVVADTTIELDQRVRTWASSNQLHATEQACILWFCCCALVDSCA